MTRGEFLKKWSAVVYEPGPICANRFAMEPDLNAILVEEGEALMKQRDTAYERLDVALLQIHEMQKVIDAVSGWNDQVPALSQVEAKLVSAFVAYKNLTEKQEGRS